MKIDILERQNTAIFGALMLTDAFICDGRMYVKTDTNMACQVGSPHNSKVAFLGSSKVTLIKAITVTPQ